jgi:hypothetical protein
MRPRRIVTGVVTLAACWYASLAVHELGHVLGGLVAGADSIEVSMPLLGFSQTQLLGNDHPLFTTTAGLLVGALLPLLVWGIAEIARLLGRSVVRFWAGFALVLNGGYLAGDAFLLGGDAGELARAGVPSWLMLSIALPVCAAGLWVWHMMGSHPRADAPEDQPCEPDFATAALVLGMGLVFVVVF